MSIFIRRLPLSIKNFIFIKTNYNKPIAISTTKISETEKKYSLVRHPKYNFINNENISILDIQKDTNKIQFYRQTNSDGTLKQIACFENDKTNILYAYFKNTLYEITTEKIHYTINKLELFLELAIRENFYESNKNFDLTKKLKHYITHKKINKFKTIIDVFEKEINIEELKKSDWNKNNIFENTINYWFDKYCECGQKQLIKFLLRFVTDLKTILYEQLKNSIKTNNFNELIFLINFFNKDIEGFNKNDCICNNIFKTTIIEWFDKLYKQKFLGYINLLISKINSKYIHEYLRHIFLIDKNYKKFCFFINNYMNIENFKKLLTNKEKELLDLWLNKKRKQEKERIEHPKIGDSPQYTSSMQNYPYDPH